jgi:hypothetical protein
MRAVAALRHAGDMDVRRERLQRELHASPETLAWTVNAYVVPFAAPILLGGKAASDAAASAFMTGFSAAMWTAAALTLLAAAVALVGLRGARTAARTSAVPA